MVDVKATTAPVCLHFGYVGKRVACQPWYWKA